MGVRSSLSLFVAMVVAASACGRTEQQPPVVNKGGSPSDSSGGSPGDSGAGSPSDDGEQPSCAVSLSAQGSHFCAVYQDGSVWCWGRSDAIAGDFAGSARPVRVELPPMQAASVGVLHACAFNDENEIWCWGDNKQGQLGPDPSTAPRRVVSHDHAIMTLSVGGMQTCFVDVLSHVYCWGERLGEGEISPLQQIDLPNGRRPVLLETPFATDEDGRAYDLRRSPAPTPFRQLGSDNAWIGFGFAMPVCIIKSSGSFWCSPVERQLNAKHLFAKAALTENAVFGGVGIAFACALTSEGRVWCEGENAWGQLGRGRSSEREPGDYVPKLQDVQDMALSVDAACVLTADGRVQCWGAYGEGRSSEKSVEVSGCEAQERPPVKRGPPPRSEHATLMRLAEAGQAQAQAVCRCSFPIDVDDANYQGFADCVTATDSAPNPICLAALEPPEARGVWDCRADQLWEEADCLASQECVDGFPPGGCGSPDCDGDAKLPNIARYCSLRPACEPVEGAEAFAGSSSVPSKAQLCDGYVDCVDGSDELNCTPGAAIFHCTSGVDVDSTTVCDGVDDCDDGSDEACL